MSTARYFRKLENGMVKCVLCPHECKLRASQFGICNVRRNLDGRLETENYGRLSAIAMDPIEKKPLYHYYPGRSILSIGSFGCNMKCSFCQNCSISQVSFEDYSESRNYLPGEIIDMACSDEDNIGIAYTYNEPAVYYEYMIDSAVMAHKKGLRNVVVTNGFINQDPMEELLQLADAFNIDIKAFSDDFYRKIAGASLKPVLEAIKQVSVSGKHFELTYLVIPGLNDNYDEFKNLISWICDECGEDTVLHISRYFPHHRLTLPPTRLEVLSDFVEIARDRLHFVYPGNTGSGLSSDTLCPECRSVLIRRNYYHIAKVNLDQAGACKNCNHKVLTYI
jgi:pyruvate formate lyase activating enzyme